MPKCRSIRTYLSPIKSRRLRRSLIRVVQAHLGISDPKTPLPRGMNDNLRNVLLRHVFEVEQDLEERKGWDHPTVEQLHAVRLWLEDDLGMSEPWPHLVYEIDKLRPEKYWPPALKAKCSASPS